MSQLKNYISRQNAPNPNCSMARRSNLTDNKWLMTDDNAKAGQGQCELSAGGTKRDVENTPKCTHPNCILTRRSSLGPPPMGPSENDDAPSVFSIKLYSHQGLGCGGPPINLTCVWVAFSNWANSFVAFCWDYLLSINTDQYIKTYNGQAFPSRSNGRCNWNWTKTSREMKIEATILFAHQNWGDAFGSFGGVTCAGHKNVPDTSFSFAR